MIRELTLEQLDKLDDGRVLTAWKQAVQRVVRDCEDRPGADKDRKVILQLSIVPKLDEDGMLRDVKASFQVKDTIPVRQSSTYSMDVRRGAGNQRQLVYNDMADDNVNQRTIDEIKGVDGE